MPLWMMQFDVEADLGIRSDLLELVFRHPDGHYEMRMRNLDVTPGREKTLLSLFSFIEQANIASAERAGARHADRFLDVLSVAAGSLYRVVRRRCLWDWSRDVTDWRRGRIYGGPLPPESPQLLLDGSVARTVEILLNADGGANEEVTVALYWFSGAFAARGARIKFQMFWMCLETLASVPSTCQKCKTPLYCPSCREVTTHRPFPRQALEQLFGHFDGDPEQALFRRAVDLRNKWLHGSVTFDRDSAAEAEILGIVDAVGQLAWRALLESLCRFSKKNGTDSIDAFQPSTFVPYGATSVAEVCAGFALGREPTLEELPSGLNFTVEVAEVPKPTGHGET
jgi:hypothetical protein